MIIAASVIFLVLAGVVFFVLVFSQKQRFQQQERMALMESNFKEELLKSQLETQELTFRKIGDELHDHVGQLLTTARIQLGIVELSLKEKPEALAAAMDTLGRGLDEMRSLSRSLNHEWLAQFDLLDNLRDEITRIKASGMHGISMETNIPMLPFTADKQIMLFRVIQEALQNALRHGLPTAIVIMFQDAGQQLTITISDNGTGIAAAHSRKTGVGMINMQNRAALLGGTISWEQGATGGTTVTIRLPSDQK